MNQSINLKSFIWIFFTFILFGCGTEMAEDLKMCNDLNSKFEIHSTEVTHDLDNKKFKFTLRSLAFSDYTPDKLKSTALRIDSYLANQYSRIDSADIITYLFTDPLVVANITIDHNREITDIIIYYDSGELKGDFKKINDSTLMENMYYKNGIIQQQKEIINGEEDGIFLRRYENGNMSSKGLLKKGIMHGIFTYCRKNGTKKKTFTWYNGVQEGTAHYFDKNETLFCVDNFKNGLRHGKWTYYHTNGQIKGTGKWNDNVNEGLATYYYPNGQIKSRGLFRKNEPDSIWVYWDSTGVSTKIEQYNKGEKVTTTNKK